MGDGMNKPKFVYEDLTDIQVMRRWDIIAGKKAFACGCQTGTVYLMYESQPENPDWGRVIRSGSVDYCLGYITAAGSWKP